MIPSIDLDPLFVDKLSGLEKVASQIYAAYSTYGFGQIINHRVPKQAINDIYQASKNFHQLPFAEKNKIRFTKNLRGFLPVNSSTLKITELGGQKRVINLNHLYCLMIYLRIIQNSFQYWVVYKYGQPNYQNLKSKY
ncbi:Uncharacterised protein [Legionella busanensis]|uniref:Non-haem dioxygenase N-terminal domain-containing protein n=1 Tax=Legionella busanensis TaxID=190655 RepID=A0A378JM90_9GAMM|nr:2-oxoglutarate and iron-dependent oxygenase domain-containing protein [Legionella busanensis]STX51413.1 Uncharacterised protein [Legionella busanensis]